MRRKTNLQTLLVLAVFLVDSCGFLRAVPANSPEEAKAEEKPNTEVQLPSGASSNWWAAAQEEIRQSEYPSTTDPMITGMLPWMTDSDQAEAHFGWSVSTAGDVNGDGFSDIIVGARYYDNGGIDGGAVFVYHGSASGLSSSPDWTVKCDQAEAFFGHSVSTAGDINGDGFSDIIVGAIHYDNGNYDEGKVFVYHGSSAGLSTIPDWTAEGNKDRAWFGSSVSTAGDINGDGYCDVIIGIEGYENGQYNEGGAFVYYGSPSGLSSHPAWTAESNQVNANFGSSVATAGDVNGDGFPDVIVGAEGYKNGQNNEGAAFVYHGSASGLSASPNWSAECDKAVAFFGYSVATIGDLNGDGFSDVIVGAPAYDNGHIQEGAAFVYHGSTSGLSRSPVWKVESNQDFCWYGNSVATAGDINCDGFSDVIVGAVHYDNEHFSAGAAYIYHGSASGLSRDPDWMTEVKQQGSYVGRSVAAAGDINGDGFPDIIVGADGHSNGELHEGAVFVYYSSMSDAKYGGGSGTAKDPYLIYTAEQLNVIGLVPDDWDKHFKLMADIDLSGFDGKDGRPSFNMIGPSWGSGFSGVFDGNRKIISNFTYHSDDTFYKGFFRGINGKNAEVKDLVLRNVDVNIGTKNCVGALVGRLEDGGSLSGCSIEGGTVSGHLQVGGLVGYIMEGKVADCFSTCSVLATELHPTFAGGLAGYNTGLISNCYSTGNVISTGEQIGGLVGRNTGTISNCYSTSSVHSTAGISEGYAGGLVGYNQGEYDNQLGIIENSYSLGIVRANYIVGGLVGWNGGHIYNSYSLSSVSGNSRVGGLVGMNINQNFGEDQYDNGKIIKSYSAGSVTADSNVGGLVGFMSSGTISASFWDIEMSRQVSSAGGTGKTTNEMQTESTFTDAGWDFTTPIWKMCGGPYHPRLWWENCPERPIHYVDADANGANNGSSWADAYNHLQDALAAAQSGCEIHVAQGIYMPGPLIPPPPPPGSGGNEPSTRVTGDRTDTFQITDGVAVKGSFAGFGESKPDARDIAAYETILSGDLNGNDIDVHDPCDLTDDPCRADNSYHVVTFVNTYQHAVLDGFTITGGNANGPAPNDSGGGMYNRYGNPTILNCNFIKNSAANGGGGVYNNSGSPTLTNCKFIGNSADSGGGIYNLKSSPTITNCIFAGNRAVEGGGMHTNNNSSPTLTNCTFTVNRAYANGGGINNEQNSSPTLTNCILWGDDPNEIVDDALSSTIVTYSDVQGGWQGGGNIDADPCFADADNGDYHLKSQAGRWNPENQTWDQDVVTSPCIDIGDSGSDWRAELWTHGERTNMGAYGGTPEASMSLSDAGNIADLNIDRRVDYRDMKLLTDKWLYEVILLPEDLSRDGFVNFTDFAIFANIWGIPEPASNPNPPDGVSFSNLDVDLSWTAGTRATSHDVYFGTSSPPPFILNQTATTFDPGTMVVGARYYWRIDEVNRSGTTTGTIWSFTTMPPPPPPPLPGQASGPNPIDGATDVSISADLSWTAGTFAWSHDVYFGTSSLPPFVGNQISTAFELVTMRYDTMYYWRIDEVNISGKTIGTTWSFTTMPPPPQPPPP